MSSVEYNQQKELICIEYLPISISVFSLIISFITLYRQRKHITVTWDSALLVLNPKTDITISGKPYPADSPVAFSCTLKIVNPSRCDISFFDLRAFNPRTNENHYILTKRTIHPHLKDAPILVTPSFPNNDNDEFQFFITIPDTNSGTLKAGSFSQIDIVIFVNKKINLDHHVMISFKIADTSLFQRSPYSNTNRRKYKAFHFKYCIDGYEDFLQAPQTITCDNKCTN